MLEDRLKDQVKEFIERREDPIKVEILRRVTMASLLGTGVVINNLLGQLNLRDDPQQVLELL